MEQVSSLRTEDKFKKTGVGEIPVEWEVANLEDVAQINMGQSPPSSSCFDYENGLPFFQGKAEFGMKYPKITKWCNSPTKIAEKGDILITVRAPVGDVNIAPERCCIGRGLAAIRGIKSDNDFLYFIMNFFKGSLSKIGQGSTFEAINKDVLFELKIPLPTFLEQKKIADILSTIDSAVEKSAQVIEKTKELKKGLMQELLTRGIGHKEFKKTKAGEIPVEWEIGSLVDIATFKNGHAFYVDGYSDKGKKVIDMLNISLEGKLVTDPETFKYVSPEVFEKYKDFHLKKGDLVIVMTDINPELALLGKTAIIDKDDEYVLNQRVGRLRIQEDKIDLHYLNYFTNNKAFLKQIHFAVNGTAQFYINTPDITGAKIAMPPLSEQKKIAEILSSVDEEIEKEVVHKEKLENIKKGLMQVLLTGKIRVK